MPATYIVKTDFYLYNARKWRLKNGFSMGGCAGWHNSYNGRHRSSYAVTGHYWHLYLFGIKDEDEE